MTLSYSFFNDYSEGAHPRILELLTETNMEQATGYGEDHYGIEAKELLKKAMKAPEAEIHFVSAGTQANFIVLSSILKPYESVIAVESGHINVHEAGAVEATGHKINLVKAVEGKITLPEIQKVVDAHHDEHMVMPRIVYISQSTERGTVYKKAELEALSEFCREKGLYLFLDGARLGMALMSHVSDLTFSDIARLTDAFYIGGTKNGALLGEAVVLINDNLKPHFRYHLKQKGALLAKGRALSLQFLGLFTDNLYFDLARHANAMAMKLTEACKGAGFDFLAPPETNQIFPILPDELIKKLQEKYGFYIWPYDREGYSAIRLVTSWATREDKVDEFIQDLTALKV